MYVVKNVEPSRTMLGVTQSLHIVSITFVGSSDGSIPSFIDSNTNSGSCKIDSLFKTPMEQMARL